MVPLQAPPQFQLQPLLLGSWHAIHCQSMHVEHACGPIHFLRSYLFQLTRGERLYPLDSSSALVAGKVLFVTECRTRAVMALFRSDLAVASPAAALEGLSRGMAMEAMMPITPTTSITSMRVKPFSFLMAEFSLYLQLWPRMVPKLAIPVTRGAISANLQQRF